MIPFHFATDVVHQANNRQVTVPAKIENTADLFTFLLRAIPLPDYFGHNWDALEECLGDLEWLGQQKLVLIHHDIPLENRHFDQRQYLHILAQAARDSHRLLVVFPEQYQVDITHILTAQN